MTETIKAKLKEIEISENVRILHCVESGSRAWGFASPDSDFDVRFIYVRPLEYYLRSNKTRDVIEWQLDNTLDINGWDLQKALRLLYKSNPTIFEWNLSPIIYYTTEDWKDISGIINNYFDKIAGLYHYLNMAKSNYRNFLQGEIVCLKKYFYVLRPILACQWILKYGTPPPVLFNELVDDCLDWKLRPVVNDLIRMKRESPEIEEGPRIAEINDYLYENIENITVRVAEPSHQKPHDWDTLNRIFISLLK